MDLIIQILLATKLKTKVVPINIASERSATKLRLKVNGSC